MTTVKPYLCATTGLIFFVGSLVVLMPNTVESQQGQQGPPDGLNVNVLNTPLPVTGEVTATVSGEVNVINDPTTPVPVTIVPGDNANSIQSAL